MKSIECVCNNGKFILSGYPNAIKIIQLNCKKSKRLADLSLHYDDLSTCNRCMEKILTLKCADYDFLREVLWNYSIILFLKCYGGNESRFHLNFSQIFGNDKGAELAFKYFKDLRNKHLVHDANSYTQAIVGAVINDKECATKVEQIVNTVAKARTLENGNYNNLHLLIQKSLEWVVLEYEQLGECIKKELESLEYEKLIDRKEASLTVPDINSLSQNREII